MENATYGLTLCAERVAVFKAISEGARQFRRVAVVADTDTLTPPCGACRQILWEFCGDVEIVLVEPARQNRNVSPERSFPKALRCVFFVASCFSSPRWPPNPPIGSGPRRYVVTMDPQRRVIENGAVAIRGERIVAAGPKAEIERRYQARQRLDRPDAILAPGLINTHTHAAMSLFRGIADDLRLQDWLEHYIFPAEAKNVTPDFVRWGTRLGCLEMLLSGTTTFTDMYYFEDVVAEAAKEAGMRGVLGETIIGFPSPDAKTPADALAFTESYLTRFHDDPLIVPAVAPHAIYTNSDETLQACRALANQHDAPLVIHLSETKHENDECLAKRHMTPTQALDSLGVFNGRTVAAHAVWVDEADMAILKARGVGIAHCPSSNMKLASGVAPVTRMLALDLAVGLGPDGPAGSNNDFNMFEEMDLAAKLQKVATRRSAQSCRPRRPSRWPPSAARARWAWKRRSARSNPASAPT